MGGRGFLGQRSTSFHQEPGETSQLLCCNCEFVGRLELIVTKCPFLIVVHSVAFPGLDSGTFRPVATLDVHAEVGLGRRFEPERASVRFMDGPIREPLLVRVVFIAIVEA